MSKLKALRALNERKVEKSVEKYLVEKIEKLGGKCYKWSSPNNRAVPDRIAILPFSGLIFIECKALGKKPTPLQAKVIKSIRNLGHVVLVIDTKEKVDILYDSALEEIKRAGRMESGNSEQQ